MKKVSVIVPVYNTEKYLIKCLDSLVKQTIKEIEILVIDDGSTDGSRRIIEEYQEKYPELIVPFYKENGGQASARNLGITHSTGEYIGFLDSDDFVRLDTFEKLYTKAISSDSDYIGCGYTDIIYSGESEVVLRKLVINPICKTNREMFYDAIVSPFINFYKGSILRTNQILFPEGVIYEDTAFWVNAIPYLNKISYVYESLAYRVRREGSTTKTCDSKKIEDIFQVIDSILQCYKERGFEKEYWSELEYFCVRILLCSSMKRVARVNDKYERRRLVKKTFMYLKINFKDYKCNTYYRRKLKDFYLKNSSEWVVCILVWLSHIKFLINRRE